MGLDNLKSGIALQNGVIETIKANPLVSAVGGVGLIGGSILGASAIARKIKRKKTKRRKTRTIRKRSRRVVRPKTRRKKKTKYPRTAGKRKDTSTRRIRMTKNGQPYIILKSGKARFIKKSSARRSRKLKGGRY